MNDHVVSHDGSQGPLSYAMECLHCGDIQRVALPIDMSCWLAMAEAYMAIHAKCPKPTPTAEIGEEA